VGPKVPIAAPLDLHTNLSEAMMRHCDAFVGYKEYPHIDMPETGARAMQLLVGIINGTLRSTMAHAKVPLIVPNQAMVTTWQSALKLAIDRAREMEADDDVLAATVLGGFPFADTPETSISTIVVTNGNPEKATTYAGELAQMCWNARSEFAVVPTPITNRQLESLTSYKARARVFQHPATPSTDTPAWQPASSFRPV
jgi:microcystin degradation protein MlrC